MTPRANLARGLDKGDGCANLARTGKKGYASFTRDMKSLSNCILDISIEQTYYNIQRSERPQGGLTALRFSE